jgi:hypothetical protein
MLSPLAGGMLSPLAESRGGAQNPILQSLLGYWKFDETSSSGSRVDELGVHPFSVASGTYEAGKIGNAQTFGVSNSGLYQSDGTAFGNAFGRTWAIWFKTTSNGDYQCIMRKGPNNVVSGNFRWFVGPDGKFYANLLYSYNVVVVSGTTNYADGAWHLLVWWIEADGTISYAVDGGSTLGPTAKLVDLIASTDVFIVGRDGQYGSYRFAGALDELGVWGRVLTSSERTELYNSGSGKTYPF